MAYPYDGYYPSSAAPGINVEAPSIDSPHVNVPESVGPSDTLPHRWRAQDAPPQPRTRSKTSDEFDRDPSIYSQDEDNSRRGQQQYTYIPSTSSFSSGRERFPPMQRPVPAYYPNYESNGHGPTDHSSYDRYRREQHHDYPPVQPVIPPFVYPDRTHGVFVPAQPSRHHRKSSPPPVIINVPGDRYPRYDAHSPSGSITSSPTMYTSVNPFQSHSKPKPPKPSLPISHDSSDKLSIEETPVYVIYPYARRRTVALALLVDFLNFTFNFFFDSLPRAIYLNFLLRLPSLYFSRVAHIFEEADMTMPEIENMAYKATGTIAITQFAWSSPAVTNLKVTWEAFIDSLLREWKVFNIVSVLLLSAILTILQIDSAGSDPVARNCALVSLICALMSLLYGCIYIIRFSSMRKTHKAVEWAKTNSQMAQETKTFIWWNVWVLLALPAVWLAWSIMFYIACIMAFVWRSGANGLESVLVLTPHAELSIRIAISTVLGVGALYFLLALNTLRLYGDSMDIRFKRDLEQRVRERRLLSSHNYGSYAGDPYHTADLHGPSSFPLEPQAHAPWFKRVKVMDFRFQMRDTQPIPDHLLSRNFTSEKWDKFIADAYDAWNGISSGPFNLIGTTPPRPQDAVATLLEKWNRKYFQPRSTLGVLCHEYIDLFPDSPTFSIYIVDVTPFGEGPIPVAERFGPLPEGLSRIDIFDQPQLERSGRPTRRILGRTSIYSTRAPLDGRVHFTDEPQDLADSHSASSNNLWSEILSQPRYKRPKSPESPSSPSGYPQERTPPSDQQDIPPPVQVPPSLAPTPRYERIPAYSRPLIGQHRVPNIEPMPAQVPTPQPSFRAGYYYAPSQPIWGPSPIPSYPSSYGPGTESVQQRPIQAFPGPPGVPRRKRSKTLSPRRRFQSLPTPQSIWPMRVDTPSSSQAMTSSGLSQLDILMPPTPFVSHQGQYPSTSPKTQSSRPRRSSRRRSTDTQDPPAPETAQILPDVDDDAALEAGTVEDLRPHQDDYGGLRRGSPSSSYRSFSPPPSPSQESHTTLTSVQVTSQPARNEGSHVEPYPDYEASERHPTRVEMTGTAGTQTFSGSGVGRLSNASVSTIDGPWTTDHLSLRTLII
ncbi:hypothetical protein H0H93_009081 [Arthromyces matolae]|nr:hypothetical protein H0H93_009081 [Arthromyces matolae]